MAEDTKIELKVIATKLEDLKGWMKSNAQQQTEIKEEVKAVKNQVKEQNSRIYKNEKNIALLAQKDDLEGKHRDKHIAKLEEGDKGLSSLEMWLAKQPRNRLIKIIAGIGALAMFLLQIASEFIRQFIQM